MAAELGIPIGTKISEYLVEPLLIRPLRPIFCFGSIVDDFRDQKNRLTAVKERVGNAVERDISDSQVIFDHVKEWRQKVNTSMQEVQHLENELKKNKSCFRYSWCPNWTSHYSFSKQVSKMTATMKTLCDRGGFFISVSHPPALRQDIIGSSSSDPFMHSQSSRSAFDQIMEALKGDDINLIRLYGGAGAGKTTMAQLVGEEAQKLLYGGAVAGKTTTTQLVGNKAKELFDHIIMVPVSRHPQVKSLQGVIADFLGLQLGQLESEQGRATKLQLRLKNGEKILIIFDDVQKEFNLSAVIGIPSLDSGCKILLTTRDQAVAEIHVDTQKNIELGALSEDEAWTLLKSIAGVGDEVRMHDVAKDALEECNGLPKAIVAMGTVLNRKDVSQWGKTLQQHNAGKFKFIDSLEEGVKNLSLRQDRVNSQIKMAKQKVEEIYPNVEKWLKDVERVMNDVEQFKNELNQNRWCLDELGVATRVEALATRIKDLHEQGNLDPVSHPTPLETDMRLLSSEDFLFSKAAESAFDQILEALKTDGVNMIGLYGMGGIGKTTLASQVHNEVIRKNELAVMVTVSQKPDVGNMQDKIADILDLKFEKRTLDQRAIELKNRLKDKKILIILDDVWKRLDLGSIGITLDDCKGCKILLTTRGRDVFSSMNCQSGIQLCLFSQDESQKLFKKKAGLSNELELDDVGKQIVVECMCLPIALETVGAALKWKGKDEWVEALKKLRSARYVDIHGVEKDEKNVYRCLQLSYDYLHDQPRAQFILLLCSLFPEDYKIEVEDLTRYAFGMKLFEEVESVEDARRKVRVTIRFLRDSCLLLDVGGAEYVKLHDVVRDVLLWVGATEPQETNTFTVRDGVHLKDLVKKKSFQNCKALSFTSDVIPKFSKYSELEFPKLEIVLILLGEGYFEFGEGFFDHMKFLKVLDVKGSSTSIWRRCMFAMPQSLHCLEHLRTLMLRNCKCSNSSILRDLGRLRVLSLLNCGIDCGVEVVSGLKKLRLLDLEGFNAERMMFASNVMERLVKLEELYGYRLEKCKDEEETNSWLSELYGYILEKCKDEEGTNSRLSEFKLPSNLVALFVMVEDVRCLPTDFCFPKLKSYDIRMGENIDDQLSSRREVRSLVLCNVMMKTCEKLLPTVQVLSLSECDDLYSLPSLSLQELESLEVEGCKKMEWVFKVGNVSNNKGSTVQILSLKILHLSRLNELRHIWEGPTRVLSLCNLTKVEIYNCPKLICIFPSPSLATSLQQLEFLKIKVCRNLEEIFSRGGSDDDDFTCCDFTNLRELVVSECDKVKTILPLVKSTGRAPHLHPQSHPCHLPKLRKILHPQNISLRSNNLLKHIWEGPIRLLSLCNLTQVKIIDCPELICIFPSPSLAASLQQLEILKIELCCNLEDVFYRSGGSDDDDFTCCCFTNLRVLKVSKCDKVKTIFPMVKSTSRDLHPRSHRCRLPKLQQIVLENNSLLEHIFGHQTQAEEGVECPSLQVLEVRRCPNISTTHLVATQLQPPSSKSYIQIVEARLQRRHDDLPQSTIICFSFLNTVKLNGCNKLKQVFTISMVNSLHLLNKLIVEGCNKLEQVVGKVEDGKEEPTIGVSFEHLMTLRVSHCGKLRTIFPISTALPQLEELELKSNAELEQVSDCDCTWECPFLKDLYLEDCPKLCSEFVACIQNPSTTEAVENIELDHVQGEGDNEDDDLVTSPFKNMSLWDSEDVKCIQRGPTQNLCFADLCQIKVIGCHKLKHLFTIKVATNFPNLRRLVVRRCNELEVIMVEDGNKERENGATTEMTGKVGFENLEVLHVSNCKNLITVFSTFIPLPKLHTLLLQSNAVLESLFGRSDCDCTSYWTCLSVLSVTGCPKLCTETIAIIRTHLQVESPTKRLRIINLANIQGVEELIQIPRQEDGQYEFLKMEGLGDLKRIWSGPTQDISFSFVVAVRVKGCSRLKQLFTTTMATSLHNLELLWVESCHDLQQIIEEEEGSDENNTQSVQQLDFSNLRRLRLMDLPKLISFCPTSCNLVLTKLTEKRVKVKGCPKPITDFFSKQSYMDRFEFDYLYLLETDSEDEDEKDDEEDGKFDNNIEPKYHNYIFGWALFGIRLKR